MKWRDLRLDRAPGVTPGLSLEDCGPGLNVVVGPNGIGKSTLSRAARAALWRSEPFERSHLHGRVVARGEEWTVEREGAQPPHWNGPVAHEPQRPDDRFRSCFHLELEDLLRQGGTEKAIARELRLEMSGRYDLDAVAVEDRKRAANTHAVRTARNELLAARDLVAKLEDTARDLLDRERGLVGLREQLNELTAATADRVALEDLLRVAEANAEREALRAGLAADDPLLARFESAEDFQRLEDLERARSETRAEVAQLRAELESAATALLELSLPSDGVDGAVLREGAERANRMRRIVDELAPPLRAELAGLAGELRGVPVPDGDREWSPEDREAAQELLDRGLELRARLAGLDRALELAETQPEPAEKDPWRGVLALLEWCTAGASGSGAATGAFGALVLAAVVLLALIVAGLAGFAVPAWAWFVPFALVVGVALRVRSARPTNSPDRDAARRRFAESGADEPRSWDEAGVRQALEELLETRAERDFDAHLRQWSRGLRLQRKDFERERAQLAADEAELRARLGAEDAGEFDLRLLLRAMERDARRRKLQEQLDDLDRELGSELAGLQQLLESVGVGRTPELASALARWEDFAARAAQEPARRQARDNAQKVLREAETRAARDSERRSAFLEARRLSDADVARAVSLAPRFADHRTRRQRLEELESESKRARKRWADRADLAQLTADELAARLQSGRSADERVAQLQKDIHAIEADVRVERGNTNLAQREVELRDATERMEEVREGVLEGVAMDCLLLKVGERHRLEGRPKVLALAERHFADYTRSRYELELATDDELVVIETATRHRLAPDQLSSGTRTQLLIALRLAYAESIEGDEALPIFLDEALLTSDPARFREVARSLGRMVAEGRQVFYLTAEPREEVEWRDALGGDTAPVKVHDLGGQLETLRRVAGSSLEIAPLPAVPEPLGDDSAGYARALGGLPPVDGFASVDALHLLQLYWDRPQAAHRVLREHRSQVGAVRSFLDQTAQPPWDDAERARFEAYVRVADRVLGLWRIGRAPRLDAETLRDTSASKSSKFDEILALAAEQAWESGALIAALEEKGVKGLHKRIIDELRDELEAHGRLATETPLGFDDLLARALDEAEPFVDCGAISREDARQLVHRLHRWLTVGDDATMSSAAD
ncbi:MAG: AAA family ATPase [Planctomycetes bacterium]|nr:AAA family ATPase [Planctomycetota bacterium]